MPILQAAPLMQVKAIAIIDPFGRETIMVEIYDGPHYAVKPDWYSDEQGAR
jgi:hypothetical protein